MLASDSEHNRQAHHDEAVRNQLGRILASPEFLKSERLRRFLTYIVEEKLVGRANDLKEYTLAVTVFDRPDSYDPDIDSIVRVEARKLRLRLDQYYQNSGRDDPIRISVPRGSYAPIILVPSDKTTSRLRRPPPWVMAVAAGVLLMTATAVFWTGGRRQHNPKEAARISIAVLPLENLSAETGREYFSEGMTDSLITQLAKIRTLRVISRTSTRRLVRTNASISEIGRQLGVTHVVEGTITSGNGRVRINAQLIEVSGDHHLWAESYERSLSDVISLEGEIAAAIARHVNAELTSGDRARLAAGRPVNPQAHEAYLRGLFHKHLGGRQALQSAAGYFQQCIDIDPAFAPAYTGLADSYNVLVTEGWLSPNEFLGKAEQAARKALELDPDLAEAQTSIASLLEFAFDWQNVERHYRKALDLDPNSAQAHYWYSDYLGRMGRMGEAYREVRLAHELDPLSLPINALLGITMCFPGRYAEAEEQFRHTLAMNADFPPTSVLLASCYIRQGKFDRAVAAVQPVARDNPRALGRLGCAYAGLGRRQEAVNVLGDLHTLAKRQYVSAFPRAIVYLCLGERERAFEWLAKAYEERSYYLTLMKIDPAFEGVRTDPRYIALRRKVNLDPSPLSLQ